MPEQRKEATDLLGQSEKRIVLLLLAHGRQWTMAGANQRVRRQGQNLVAHFLPGQVAVLRRAAH